MQYLFKNKIIPHSNLGTKFESIYYNRGDYLQNTRFVLKDPKKNKEVTLIGSLNSSTFLANQTKRLIQDYKPDDLFVMADQDWYKQIQNTQITNQEIFNQLNSSLNSYNFDVAITRKTLFNVRIKSYLFVLKQIMDFQYNFQPHLPGLEIKLAIEQQLANKGNVHYLGQQLDSHTIQQLQLLTKTNPFSLLYEFVSMMTQGVHWRNEYIDYRVLLSTYGGENFTENVDFYRNSWMIALLQKLSSEQKTIMIDRRDQDIFRSIYDAKGKKVVAVVNQWHMNGIIKNWLEHFNVKVEKTPINPIGDMDINALMEREQVNKVLRALTSKLAKTEPATWKDYITIYHKDNYEPERIRNVSFDSATDKHMYDDLPNNPQYNDMNEKFDIPKNDIKSRQMETTIKNPW